MLVSALIADGPPSWLLEAAIEGRIELVLPDIVLQELRRVLTEKLGFSAEQSHEAVRLLVELATLQPTAAVAPEAVSGDAAGDAILTCAVEAGADVLATGDRKHLLPLAEYRGVRILTPQAVLGELRRPA